MEHSTPPIRRVGVIVDFAYSFGRDIAQGIAGYGITAHWRLQKYFVSLMNMSHDPPDWEVDGIIAQIMSDKLQEKIARYGVPVVSVSNVSKVRDIPSVFSDGVAIGRMAASHFLERGFHNHAIVYRARGDWSYQRKEGYSERLSEHGFSPRLFMERLPDPVTSHKQSQHGIDDLKAWVFNLPRPTAIFCVDDVLAELVVNATHDVGRHVPEDFSVIGVGNDSMIVDSSTPPLSSIDVNANGIGFGAAKMLDQLMTGKTVTNSVEWVQPRGVIVRTSSDLLAITDPCIADAVSFIRNNVARGISVQDILAVVPVSRRPLERKFKKQLNRTVLEEIHRSRIERAKILLVSTELSIKEISAESGFQNPTYFGVLFRQVAGKTPTSYRDEYRHHKLH